MATLTTTAQINAFRFLSVKHQLKLEKLGMRSSGRALRPLLAKEFGLSPRAPYADYIAYCEKQAASAIEAANS